MPRINKTSFKALFENLVCCAAGLSIAEGKKQTDSLKLAAYMCLAYSDHSSSLLEERSGSLWDICISKLKEKEKNDLKSFVRTLCTQRPTTFPDCDDETKCKLDLVWRIL